jgi:hypothetical protein
MKRKPRVFNLDIAKDSDFKLLKQNLKPECHSYSCKIMYACADAYGGDINVVPPCGNRRACSQYSVEDLHKVLLKTMNFMAALCCGNQLKARELMSDEKAQEQIVHFVKQLSTNVNFIAPPMGFVRKGMRKGKK